MTAPTGIPTYGRVSTAVDVVIVNWNAGQDLIAAAESAIRFGASVIVVDNASTDGSIDAVAAAIPEVTIVRMHDNVGFAAGCNAGVKHGHGAYVFLLNPDARIEAGSIADIEDAFAFDPTVRIVGPDVLDRDGKRVRSTRRFPTVATLLLTQLKLRPFARWIPPLRRYFMLEFDGAAGFVDQVIGAAFIMRRRDWEVLGGMDEGYFLLYEEVDLCRRVATAGGRALHWPHIVVRHAGSVSFRRLSHVQLQRIANKSLLRYSRRHLGLRAAAAVAATFPLSVVLSAILDFTKRPLRGSSRG